MTPTKAASDLSACQCELVQKPFHQWGKNQHFT